jgi:tetratricopeptide (TPR) repeat protein
VKHLFALITCIFFYCYALTAQGVSLLQKEAEKLEATSQEAAFKKYQEILKFDPINSNALCKSSEMCSLIGHRQVKKEDKVSYFRAARKFAEIALKINPNNAEANFAMAVSMGRMALISNGKQKIEAVNDIKKYAELAIKSDPSNFKAYHVLGRWHYEVSNLSVVERTAAKILYGGLPPASLKEAIAYYEKSMLLSPTFALNHLELAKAYNRNKQRDKAVALLKKILAMPNTQQDDARVKEEAKKMQHDFGVK